MAVLAIHWQLFARLLRAEAFKRWIQFEVAFQLLVLVAAAGYLLLGLRRHPAGIVWGAPGAAALVANALALQAVLFHLMRILRQG